MELRQLRAFEAVASTGSFSRGAGRLYVSHSSLSRDVAALEEELGVKLIERGNRVLGLTPAGETLLREARAILAAADAAAERTRAAAEESAPAEESALAVESALAEESAPTADIERAEREN